MQQSQGLVVVGMDPTRPITTEQVHACTVADITQSYSLCMHLLPFRPAVCGVRLVKTVCMKCCAIELTSMPCGCEGSASIQCFLKVNPQTALVHASLSKFISLNSLAAFLAVMQPDNTKRFTIIFIALARGEWLLEMKHSRTTHTWDLTRTPGPINSSTGSPICPEALWASFVLRPKVPCARVSNLFLRLMSKKKYKL
uniref:Uncharacterized protein n=1 Tax=Gasterosteus aculeatus TaxID=69293 RepID=G3Q8A4_GASAC